MECGKELVGIKKIEQGWRLVPYLWSYHTNDIIKVKISEEAM